MQALLPAARHKDFSRASPVFGEHNKEGKVKGQMEEPVIYRKNG